MVLGDSGVGKTSLVHLAAHNEPIKSPSWTVGCAVEVKLHEYKESTKDQTTFFIEFWDVGGSKNHKNAREVFYKPTHGVILVHDLTNRKSEENLHKWLAEVLQNDSSFSGTSVTSAQEDLIDAENLMGTNTTIPILVVGTKIDQLDEKRSGRLKKDSFSARYNAEEILLDCRQARYLAAGTSNAVKLSKFYDKVIENKLEDQNKSFTERLTGKPVSPTYSSKFYFTHRD